MSRSFGLRPFAATVLSATVVVASAGLATADGIVVDGDALTPTTSESSISFGTVPCGTTVTRTASVAIARSGNYTNNNSYKAGSTAQVTAAVASGSASGLSTSDSAQAITIPSTWSTASNGTETAAVDVTVTLTSSTAGAGTGSVTFSAKGVNSSGGSLTKEATLNASWTTGPCSLPTTTTVSCPDSPTTFTGAALEPCTAMATAGDGWSTSLPVTYSGNLNAGTATATARWTGDAKHLASSGSATFQIAKAPSTVSVSCPSSVTYTGSAQTPCTAGVTGAGDLAQDLEVAYADNTTAGTATATAAYAGDANHTASTGSATFAIGKASSSVSLTCPTDVTFDGEAHPCTGTVSGAGGLTAKPSLTYSPDDVSAGTVTATGTWGGDANHDGSSATGTYTIGKAGSQVTITCADAPQVYTGAALDACSARVTGPGGLDEVVPVAYDDNVNAGTVAVSAAYEGDSNHEGSTATASFVIAKAPSTVAISCDDVTYTGSAQNPCAAKVTGVGNLSEDVAVTYADNTNAGTATATAVYAGDRNHEGSTGVATFAIARATSSVTITCDAVTYTGSAQKPCTAIVSGAGVVDESVNPELTYANNVNAGTGSVQAVWAGDANHTGSTSELVTFAIAKAPATAKVTCQDIVFNGTEQRPCTGTVTGAGGLELTIPGSQLSITNNTNAGTGGARLLWDGDANHLAADSGDVTFTIAKAPSSVTVTCPTAVDFTGSALTPCTATATGVGMDPVTVTDLTYANNTKAGTATVTATWAGDANHVGSTGTGSFTINPWNLKGFYQPVDMGAGVLNTVKGGSTVPLKFEAFVGATEITTTSQLGATFTAAKITCATGLAEDAVEVVTTGGTSLRYADGQFIQNWQTPKAAGSCYKVTVTAADGSAISASFKLK
ncbi:hypothetical protein BCF74_1204 [Knoellia remsis]|uniref:Ig-like domain-containing protein n=1 Tax=Knoellia remsis TaxID=407159 RepID=A0A2T0UE13_9MICO|nr:PxKF domain-containing protein [Knoellia remsis]PRY56057.1 hypothetical protein BCF74_1204 [Knoellia remsis]